MFNWTFGNGFRCVWLFLALKWLIRGLYVVEVDSFREYSLEQTCTAASLLTSQNNARSFSYGWYSHIFEPNCQLPIFSSHLAFSYMVFGMTSIAKPQNRLRTSIFFGIFQAYVLIIECSTLETLPNFIFDKCRSNFKGKLWNFIEIWKICKYTVAWNPSPMEYQKNKKNCF